jgi:hypothetical protein
MALAGVLIFAAVATFFSAALLHSLSVQSRLVQDKYNYTRALYLSESGLNRAAEAMWIGYLNTNPLPSARMAWLDAHYRDFDQSNIAVGDGGDTYTVSVRRVMTTGNSEERLIVFEATGNAVGGTNASDRTITRVVRFGHDQGSIFDYTYFINNFGWFWGSTIYANGDVRANANFDLKYTPRVNGDVYSSVNSDVGAAGTTTGTYTSWDLATYRSNAQSNWRPSRPEFQYGYSGTSQKFTQQDVLEMPYLGDINRFVALSESKNGTLHTDSVTLNGQPTTAVNIPHVINGPILLIGTAAHPIVIDGPVVVRGDVAIAGYVQGQGTIYSDRNVHIIGDILYKDPPSYDHAVGADPTVNAQHNTHADFLGLAARGNVILGDYTNSDFTNYVVNYIKPPFTASYTDEDGTRNSGDYTAVDGKKSDNSNRKKYEGTWTNTQFQSMVAQAKALFGRSDYKPRQIDALAYTNHLYAGRVQDCKFNGAIMSRDEGIVYNGSVTMNYDYRAKSEGEYYIDIDLPKAANAEPTVWLEGPYENWIAKLDPLDHSLTH